MPTIRCNIDNVPPDLRDHFQSLQDMIDSIVSTQGERYASAVMTMFEVSQLAQGIALLGHMIPDDLSEKDRTISDVAALCSRVLAASVPNLVGEDRVDDVMRDADALIKRRLEIVDKILQKMGGRGA